MVKNVKGDINWVGSHIFEKTIENASLNASMDGYGALLSHQSTWNSDVISALDGYGGGGSPAGTDGYVQYNNGGSFGASIHLYYDAVNGRVGIGTVSPSSKLHTILGESYTNASWTVANFSNRSRSDFTPGVGFGSRIAFEADNASKALDAVAALGAVWEDATAGAVDSALTFYTRVNSGSYTERMRVTSDGNVVVGTTTASARLHAYNDTSGGCSIRSQNPNSGTAAYAGFTATALNAGNTNGPRSNLIAFGAGYSGSIAGQTLANAATIYCDGFTSKLIIGNDTSAPIYLYTAGTVRQTILSDGKVGIGQTSPANLLSVNGAASIGSNTTAPSNGLIVGGNLGVGGAGASYPIHVTHASSAPVVITRTAASFILYQNTTASYTTAIGQESDRMWIGPNGSYPLEVRVGASYPTTPVATFSSTGMAVPGVVTAATSMSVGTTTAKGKLYVYGDDLYIDSGGGGTYSSRLKGDTGGLWVVNGTTANSWMSLYIGTYYGWDVQAEIQYSPGTVGAGAGLLKIGQLSKLGGSNYTHGITAFYTNGIERLRIDNAGKVGIGTTAPADILHVISNNDATYGGITIERAYTSASAGAGIFFKKANGTISSKSAVSVADKIMSIVAQGYDGSAYISGALFNTEATTVSSGIVAQDFLWRQQPTTGGSVVETMRLTANGRLGIGVSSPSAKLDIVGDLEVNGNIWNPALKTALDGYASVPNTAATGDGYLAFFTGVGKNIAGDNDLYYNRENNRLVLSGGSRVGMGTSGTGFPIEVWDHPIYGGDCEIRVNSEDQDTFLGFSLIHWTGATPTGSNVFLSAYGLTGNGFVDAAEEITYDGAVELGAGDCSSFLIHGFTPKMHFVLNGEPIATATSDGYFGIGTLYPIEPLTINGAIAIKEQLSAANTKDGYGKIYAKSDGYVYYQSGQGSYAEYNLTRGSGGYLSTPFTSQTSVSVTHNFGIYPIVQVINNSYTVIDPQSIVHDTVNGFTVTFSGSTSGTIIARA